MHTTLSHFIVELAQNSIDSGATNIEISLIENERVCLTVKDNGSGFSREQLDSFNNEQPIMSSKHDNRKYGNGLERLKEFCKTNNGIIKIDSNQERNTIVTVELDSSVNIGDVSKTFRMVLSIDGDYEIVIYRAKEGSYTVSRREIINQYGDLSIVKNLKRTKSYFMDLEKSIN